MPMIARLDTTDAGTAPGLAAPYLRFLEALKAAGFEGEIAPDYADRTVLATDNSIYQRLPQAALYPRHGEDLQRTAHLAGQVGDALQVLAVAGTERRLGPGLVEGVVGGQYRAIGVVGGELGPEAGGLQGLEKAQVGCGKPR